jgi:hypothetical protein
MPEPEKNKLSIQQPKQRGGIAFPLDYEDISALKQSFVGLYQVVLQNGAATIYDTKILPSSIGLATHSFFAGTIGVLRVECGNGFANVISSSDSDNSIVNVAIFY